LLTWFLGYVLMLAGKAFLSAIILGPDEIAALSDSLKFRLSMSYDKYSASTLWYIAIAKSLFTFFYTPLVIFTAICGVLYIFYGKKIKQLGFVLVFSSIAVLPLIWLGIGAQPTYIHYWFQGRTLGLSFFSFVLAWLLTIDMNKIHQSKWIKRLTNNS